MGIKVEGQGVSRVEDGGPNLRFYLSISVMSMHI